VAVKSFRDRNPYFIGLGSIVIIGVLVTIAFLVGLKHLLDHDYKVRAVFSDAAGIRGGDVVRVAGVKSGRVTKVRADRVHGNVIVDLVVNDNIKLGQDVHAEVALETLLGTKYVRLSGPVHAPYLRDMPSNQRVIPVDRTKTPFDVFELTKIGTRSIEATDTEKLNQLITQLGTVTEGKHEQIGTLLQSVATLSTAINARDAQLRDLLDQSDKLSGTLQEKDQTLVALIDQSQAILELVTRRKGDIAAGLQAGNAAMGEVAGVLDRNSTQIDAILNTLHPTLNLVEKHQADLDRALTLIGPGSYGLGRAAAHGPWAEVYVRAVGPDYVALIKQQFPNGLPVEAGK
jgi:phospholipid/cholesterol/gamma-HCH transport system substrate-binding protein